MSAAPWYRWDGDDLLLCVRVQPRARRSAFAGAHGDALKLKLAAPPVDGRANDELVRFVAERFAVPRSAVILVSGQRGRAKRLRVHAPGRLPEELAGAFAAGGAPG